MAARAAVGGEAGRQGWPWSQPCPQAQPPACLRGRAQETLVGHGERVCLEDLLLHPRQLSLPLLAFAR